MTRFRDRTSREEGTVVFLPSLLLNRRKYEFQYFFSPLSLLVKLAISWRDGACIFRQRKRGPGVAKSLVVGAVPVGDIAMRLPRRV